MLSASSPQPAAGPSGPSRQQRSPPSAPPRVWAILEPLSDAARSALQALASSSSNQRPSYLELTTEQSTFRVGRSAENDLALRTNAAKISTHHATLERITGGEDGDEEVPTSTSKKKKKKALATLEDSSRNGTSINGTKVRLPLSLSLSLPSLVLMQIQTRRADQRTYARRPRWGRDRVRTAGDGSPRRRGSVSGRSRCCCRA